MKSLPPIAGVLLVASLGCATTRYQTVMVPPRIDLTEHDIIAVVEFESSNEGQLGSLATRRFTDQARRDQGLVRMVTAELDGDRRDGRVMRDLGERHGAKSVLIGTLQVSEIQPSLSLARALDSASLTATVEATLTVDLIETETGASIWSASASASETVGDIRAFSGDFTFDAKDPDQAYGALVDALVNRVTADFQATWVRQPIAR